MVLRGASPQRHKDSKFHRAFLVQLRELSAFVARQASFTSIRCDPLPRIGAHTAFARVDKAIWHMLNTKHFILAQQKRRLSTRQESGFDGKRAAQLIQYKSTRRGPRLRSGTL